MALYCLENDCKFDRKEKKNKQAIDMTQCSFCCNVYHNLCVGIKDPVTVWPCPSCRCMSADIKSLSVCITSLLTTVNDLKVELKENHDATKLLVKKCDELSLENKALNKSVVDLTVEVNKNKWKGFTSGIQSRSLLIGDSAVNNIESEKLINTTVDSLKNATVDDVLQKLTEHYQDGYSDITVCVGSVNCADEAYDADSSAEKYKEVIKVAKDLVPHVSNIKVSSIPPSTKNTMHQQRIEEMNTRLISIAEITGAKYVNNDTSFKLADGSPNDGYVQNDGRGLTRSGTNRLAKNLGLRIKQAHKNDVCKSHEPVPKKKAKPECILEKGEKDEWIPVTRRRKHHRDDTRASSRPFNGSSKQNHVKPACWNCGERNHLANACRHGKRLVCDNYESLGHKAKFCTNY